MRARMQEGAGRGEESVSTWQPLLKPSPVASLPAKTRRGTVPAMQPPLRSVGESTDNTLLRRWQAWNGWRSSHHHPPPGQARPSQPTLCCCIAAGLRRHRQTETTEPG